MKFLFFILLSLIAIIVIIRYIEANSIFFPMKGVPPVTEQAVAHEDVFFKTTDDKKLHGRFIAASDPKSSTVLFFHGNAGNIGHRWEKIRVLRDLGVSVLIFDYRGYGQSEGKPSETGIYKDTEATFAYLAGRGILPERIIVYGESIGGAFAIDAATKKSVQALIVEDTFTSVPAMVRRTIPFIPTFILATRLDSFSKISKISVPKLIFHSLDDEIVPFEMGKALSEAAIEPKRFVQLRGGHNTAFSDDFKVYQQALARFLSDLNR